MAQCAIGAGLAPHFDLASPREADHRSKGVRTPGRHTGVLRGRAIGRRGLGIVWPEKDTTMTRARTTKSIIRARMARTGERYTTARRHVLAPAARPAAAPAPSRPAAASTPGAGADSPRGAVSDARLVARTGHDLAHWFALLDRFGGVGQGHTALARHLRDAHGVPAWYSQGITVAYERIRGGRSINQRPDGAFDFGVSKIVVAPLADVRSAFTAARRRAVWTRGLDSGLVVALADGVAGRTGRGFTARSQGQSACRFPWGTSAVELMLTPLPDGRTRVAVQHGKLPSLAAIEARRPLWKAALAALGEACAPAAPSAGRRPRARGADRG